MDDLFATPSAKSAQTENSFAAAPLATRMRPRSLEEFAGQDHILGEGQLLRRSIAADRFSSLIFFGPPGVGKTSLAEIIAQTTQARFVRLSGVESKVADIRREVQAADAAQRIEDQRTILFVDEIHRFNKAQQDVLLPDIERGRIRFIGATTHNPFFYVNSPLVSRSQVFALEPLSESALLDLLRRALTDKERGLGQYPIHATDEALTHLATRCDGDARQCLNALELGVLTTPPNKEGVIPFTLEIAEQSIQKKAIVYDGDEDAHYDTISAFIKSMRGSDPDAALYWLAKMLYAGEDIRFIARRIVICASEDVGMADPRALTLAVSAQQAVEFIGMPEAQIPLAQATVYIATAPKSNRSYEGIGKAMADVKAGRTLPVPKHLRDAHYRGAEKLGHGEGYQYSHSHEDAYVPQAYLPEGRRYYEPSDRGYEKMVAERLAHWREQFAAAQEKSGETHGKPSKGNRKKS